MGKTELDKARGKLDVAQKNCVGVFPELVEHMTPIEYTLHQLNKATKAYREAAEAEIQRLSQFPEESILNDAVDSKLLELNKSAQDFDTDLWKRIRNFMDDNGLDWRDYPDGINAYEVDVWLTEFVDSLNAVIKQQAAEIERLKKENEWLKEITP